MNYKNGNNIIDPNNASVSDSMFNYIQSKEGYSSTSYKDTGGVWTIGYGHTSGVTSGMTCTTAQAVAWLTQDIQNAVNKVLNVVTVPITQNQLDALADFIYNTGATSSSLFTYVNNGDWNDAATFLTNHYITDSNGNELQGLVSRRSDEANLLIA